MGEMKHYKNQVFLRIYVRKVSERTENREKQIAVNISNRNEENKKIIYALMYLLAYSLICSFGRLLLGGMLVVSLGGQ